MSQEILKQLAIGERACFDAVWGTSLRVISVAATLMLFGIASVPLFVTSMEPRWAYYIWLFAMTVVPLGLWAGSLLFMIRGYVLTPDILYVQRLLWKTKVSLAGLCSAVVDADAVKKSIRTCGNGGMFSFTGWFWNKQLGSFRAFATNSKDVVVMRFGGGKVVVVTPSQPREFVDKIIIWRESKH